jgi:hypothetical protein
MKEASNQKSGSHSGFEGFTHQFTTPAIQEIIGINKELSSTDKDIIIDKALHKCGKSNNFSPDSFLEKVKQEEKKALSTPKSTFFLLTTISTHPPKERKKKTTDGIELIFEKNPPRKNFIHTRENFLGLAENYICGNIPNNYSFIRLKIQERNKFSATQTAFDRLDLARSIWNLCLNGGKIPIIWESNRPLNRISLGPFHTLHNQDGSSATEDTIWYDPNYNKPAKPEHFLDIQKTIRPFERKIIPKINNSPYSKTIKDFLIRYNRALDQPILENCFLQLWSLLESLTASSGTNSNNKNVVDRIAFLSAEPQYEREILDAMREKRNIIVHQSTKDEIHTLAFQAKFFAEKMLFFHINNSKKFSCLEEAGEFLSSPANPKDIRKKIFLLNKALETKK